MSTNTSNDQPSTGFLLGIGASFVPILVIQRVLTAITKRLHTTHPRLKERLQDAEGKSFLFVVSDMPFNVLLRIKEGQITCRVLSKQNILTGDVTLRAASQKFITLLEGTEDGDALFFSRHLEVEGDTEALIVLRNSLDNERIDIHNIVYSVFGPFSLPARRLARPLERLGTRFSRDMQSLHHMAMRPLARQQQALAQRLEILELRLNKAETLLARKTARNASHD